MKPRWIAVRMACQGGEAKRIRGAFGLPGFDATVSMQFSAFLGNQEPQEGSPDRENPLLSLGFIGLRA